jgi:hypothetical protein
MIKPKKEIEKTSKNHKNWTKKWKTLTSRKSRTKPKIEGYQKEEKIGQT